MAKRGRPLSRRYDALGEVPSEPGYYIYELWADEVCLYVGRVGDNGPGSVRNRLSHHAHKPWWPQVTRIKVTSLSGHEEVAAEEPRRIRALQPRHNRIYRRFCRNGHDQNAPGVRYKSATVEHCAECQRERGQRSEVKAQVREWQREYSSRPEVRERDRSRKRRATVLRRGPGAGQEGLW